MRKRADCPNEGAGARGPITRAFDEAIKAAIPEAGPGRPGLITEVFAEAIRAAIPAEGEERALLADVVRELRRFVAAFDGHPEWLWSPATVRFVRAVRPKLELLGGPIGPADGGELPDEGRKPDAA